MWAFTTPRAKLHMGFYDYIVYMLPNYVHASLADCLLVSDYGMDSPHTYWLHQTPFLAVQCPHHLMIVLSSCTLRVASFRSVLLSRFRLQPVPLEIQPPTSLRRLVRHF